MRTVKYTKQFRKDYERLKASGRRDMEKLHIVLDKLIEGQLLEARHNDHPLKGELSGCRDCHIEGDWVLIYELGFDDDGSEAITFHATDNHSNLFG